MLTCQFCNYDYSDEGLREGRCPACGVLLEWVDVGPAATEQNPPAPTTLSHSTVALPNSDGMPAGHSPHSQPPNSDSPGDSDPKRTKADLTGRETITQPVASPDIKQTIDRLWSSSTGLKTARPNVTIQPDSSPIGLASQLVIRPRSINDHQTSDRGLADYEMIEMIGEGGVGVVYAARQASIDRTVAIKMLKSQTSDEKGKFLCEAVVTGDLDHPNIVPIYDLGSNKDGELFYSMKRVQGTPWSQVLAERSLLENLEILLKVCDAVAFAHDRGVIHRDLKPENVMLGDFGEVLVMDWGLAISRTLVTKVTDSEKITSVGGTPAYMAPEMATGPVDAIAEQSDVYLLGAILYEIITDQTPHTGASGMDCLYAAARNEIQPTDASGELLDIALWSMRTQPASRPQGVNEFQSLIREYQSHSESIALVARAEDELAQARQSNDYQDYARAVFAFEEAAALWPENRDATTGRGNVLTQYAQSAFEKGDYDLGLSLLDKDDPQHRTLFSKLQAAERERRQRQRRLKSMRATAALLVAVLFLGAVGASIVIAIFYQDARKNAKMAQDKSDEAERNYRMAKTKEKEANDNANEARLQKADAVDKGKIAQRKAKEALTARQATDVALHRREAAIEDEEWMLYKSQILLAHERINDNQYNAAVGLLDTQVDSAKRKLRHWEWGRLHYLCSLQEATLATGTGTDAAPVRAVALSTDERTIAVGFESSVLIWRQDEAHLAWDTQPAPLRLSPQFHVHSLAFDPVSKQLAIGGGDGKLGNLEIWDVASDPPVPIRVLSATDENSHTGRVTDVTFGDNNRLLSASADQTARLWNHTNGDLLRVFYGHFDAVTSAEFSTDEALVVTASEDGSARVWDVETGLEIQRFSSHAGRVHAATFFPNEDRVASAGSSGEIYLWSVHRPTRVDFANRSSGGANPFLKAREAFVKRQLDGTGDEDELQEEFTSIQAHRGPVTALTFSVEPSNNAGGIHRLVSAGGDNVIRVWNVDAPPTSATTFATGDQPGQRMAKPLLTLRGHGSRISCCVASATSSRILTGSLDTTARLWDRTTYREVEELVVGNNPINGLAISPQGTFFAAAYTDGTAVVQRRNTPEAKRLAIPPLQEGHDFLAGSAAIDHASRLLYTSGGDATVRKWNLDSGAEVKTWEQTGSRGVMALAPNGTWLVTGSNNKSATVWRNGTTLTLDHGKFLIKELKRTLRTATDEGLQSRVFGVTAACIAPDNQTVFIGNEDGNCWLWQVEEDSHEDDLFPERHGGHRASIVGATFFDYQENVKLKLLTASADHTVCVWDLYARREEKASRMNHTAPVQAVALSPDEKFVVSSTVMRVPPSVKGETYRNIVSLYYWRLGASEPVAVIDELQLDGQPVERVHSIRFAPQDPEASVPSAPFVILSCSLPDEDVVLKWDMKTRQTLQGLRVSDPKRLWTSRVYRGNIACAIFAPHDQVVTVGGRGAALWSDDGQKERTFRPHSDVRSVCFSHDERYIVTASSDGSAKVWDIGFLKDEANGKTEQEAQVVCKLEQSPIEGLGGHRGAINQATFHPTDPGHILTCSADGTAKLWQVDFELGTATVTHTLGGTDPTHAAAVTSANFSPQGKQIVTTALDGTTHLWRATDWDTAVGTFEHSAAVNCSAFSPDSQWIITGSDDNVASVWSVVTGHQLVRIVGHSGPVTDVAFSPDGQRILTASRDRTVRVWDVKKIVDASRGTDDEQRPLPDIVDFEMMTLEHHTSDVTGAIFSPDGSAVLTAGLDGSLLQCHSDPLAPSILLSVNEKPTTYKPGSDWIRVDQLAIVRQPHITSLENYQLVVELVGGNWGAENLEIQPHHINMDHHSILADDVPIATFTATPNEELPDKLTVTFTTSAKRQNVQNVIRSLCYRNDKVDVAETRKIRIYLQDQRQESGNFIGGDVDSAKKIRMEPPEDESVDTQSPNEMAGAVSTPDDR